MPKALNPLAVAQRRKARMHYGHRFLLWLSLGMLFTKKGRLSFYRRIEKMADQGLPIKELFERGVQRYEKRSDNRARGLKFMLDLMNIDSLNFEQAIQCVVPPEEGMVIVAGAQAGNLGKGMRSAIFILESMMELRKALKSQLLPIGAMTSLLILMLYIATTEIMPLITVNIPEENWSHLGQTFKAFSLFLGSKYITLIAIMSALVVWTSWAIPNWSDHFYRVRQVLDHHMPPFTIYRRYQASALTMAVSMMLQTEKSLEQVIQIYRSLAGPWMSRHLKEMQKAVERAEGEAQVLTTSRLFDQELHDDLLDYGQMGVLNQVIGHLGKEVVEETIIKTKNVMDITKDVVLFLMAGIALWMFAGIMTSVMEYANVMLRKAF